MVGLRGHRQSEFAIRELALETDVAIVRYCDVNSRDRMRSGDDINELTGTSGDEDYTTNMEQRELLEEVSRKPKHFLSCKLANYGRVPVLGLTYSEIVTYHGKLDKRLYNDAVIDALGPGESRPFWVVNTDNNPVVFHPPDRVTYYRPALHVLQQQSLSQQPHDYWILRRSADPQEH